MQALIVSYRRGRHNQTPNQLLLTIPTVTDRVQAEKLVSKHVVWKTPTGKEIKGEVRAAHGNSGCLRVLFEKGLPGQALGTKAEVQA